MVWNFEKGSFLLPPIKPSTPWFSWKWQNQEKTPLANATPTSQETPSTVRDTISMRDTSYSIQGSPCWSAVRAEVEDHGKSVWTD